MHNIIYLKEMRPTQQLYSRLCEKIPEARSLAVGAMKRLTEQTVTISDSDLVLAPTEFNFDPSSNAIAYLTSLVKAVAIMELVPQMLSIITQRMVSELFQITEKCLAESGKDFRRGMGTGDSPLFVPVLRGNMSKSDSNEFDSFVPHLRRHCGRVIGRLLAIGNAVTIIGEAVRQIVTEAGSMIDVHSFYRNCLSALHGEVKNWLSSLLHGSKTAKRVYTNPTVAIIDALKGKKTSKETNRAVHKSLLFYLIVFSLYINLLVW